MKWFKSNKIMEIEHLLKISKQDFGFDSKSVKARIMMAARSRHFSHAEVKALTWRPSTWPKYAFSASLAFVLLLGTTGLALASNQATPGDALFKVQKFQNQIVLSLPLPESQKEEIRTEIAAKRLKDLDTIQNNPKANTAKVQAAIEESRQSMDEAILHLPTPLSEKPQAPTTAPDTKNRDKNSRSEKLNLMVTKLENLSKQHEDQIETIKQKADNDNELKIETSLISIKANKAKLLELRNKRIKEDGTKYNNAKRDNND